MNVIHFPSEIFDAHVVMGVKRSRRRRRRRKKSTLSHDLLVKIVYEQEDSLRKMDELQDRVCKFAKRLLNNIRRRMYEIQQILDVGKALDKLAVDRLALVDNTVSESIRSVMEQCEERLKDYADQIEILDCLTEWKCERLSQGVRRCDMLVAGKRYRDLWPVHRGFVSLYDVCCLHEYKKCR
ncbi:hypothetical protein ACOME3_006089 [Neoechinorhynchus agilis]